MKTIILSVIILLLNTFVFSQSCKIILQDSFSVFLPLEYEKNAINLLACAIKNKNLYISVAKPQPVLYKYDCLGTKKDSINLCAYINCKLSPSWIGITTTSDDIVISTLNQWIFYNTLQGKIYKKIIMPKNSSYFIDADFNHFNFIVHKNTLTVPFDKIKIINTYRNYANNRYVYFVCNVSEGELKVSKKIQKIAEVYKKMHLRHLTGRYVFSDTNTNKIYITQEASNKVNVISAQDMKNSFSFGEPFKHANPVFTLQPYNHKKDPYMLYSQYFALRIESNLSKEVFVYNNRIYRTYTIAIKDTTRHKIMNKEEYKTYLKTHKRTCSSALPDIVVNQVRLEQSKPYGLQIYNEKYELIFDEIMPTPFNILKIENNELWVHGRYDEATQKYWIYKYKIDYSQP